MILKAREITTTSWIIEDENGTRLGLATKPETGLTVTVYWSEATAVFNKHSTQETYKSINEFAQKHKITLYKEKKDDEVNHVEGYPVNTPTPCKIESDPFITFTKNETAKTRYGAGFFVFLNEDTEQHYIFECPKLSTIEKANVCYGPFKTKFDASLEASAQNKRLANERN